MGSELSQHILQRLVNQLATAGREESTFVQALCVILDLLEAVDLHQDVQDVQDVRVVELMRVNSITGQAEQDVGRVVLCHLLDIESEQVILLH